MKNRERNDGEKQGGERRKNKKRNEQRLGGKALSLEAFAKAKSKSRPSDYNPSLVKKQREFYRNAKYVSKFKKSIKREHGSEYHRPTAVNLEGLNENDNKKRPTARKKKISLQSLREEVDKKRTEAEKAKMEREAMIQAKKEERAKAETRRKAQREKMLKKTRSGQPVMKYKIEHLLQGILQDSTS